MPDDAEWCCAAGVCCNEPKRREKLAQLLKDGVPHLSPVEALAAARWLHDNFDILPRSLNLGDFLERFAAMAREHPYT